MVRINCWNVPGKSLGSKRRVDVILPARYIAELFDDLIRVDLADAELEQLREYKEAD
jgi:hypothetical protein